MCAGMYNFYKFFYSNKNNYKNNLNKNIYAQKNYGENFTELKKSAEKIKNLDLSDENSVAEVKNFLSEYNKNSTAKNNYESKIYESIGISTKFNGDLELDENKFNSAIKNNSDRVSSILKNLANKAENIQSTQNLYNRAGYNYSSVGNLFNYYL